MQSTKIKVDRNIEKAVREILKSRARSRIYLYLLRKNGAKTEQIIKGTRLHPSTVRESLSKMYDQKLIYRKKIRNDCIGKNPYIYRAAAPLTLLKRYAKDLETKLNKIARLTTKHSESTTSVHIEIEEVDT